MSYESWVQPPYLGNQIVLDGTPVVCHGPIEAEPLSSGPRVLRMGDYSAVLQVPGYRAKKANLPESYRFQFEQQADVESEWSLVDRVLRLARAVYLIPYKVETEVFTAESGDTAFTLQRVTAKTAYPSFNETDFPTTATLNGVAQTVLATGPPTSGQVVVAGAAVTTPALATSDELVIRYYPAYAMIANPQRESLEEFGEVVRRVELWETKLQVPA